ncbi:MAG: chemotaxis protein CheA [Candidatus Eisenbacteria bacterium]
MTQESIVTTLESVSEQVLLLDANDLPSVASIHTELQGVAARLGNAPKATSLVSSCLGILDSIVLREDPGVADPISVLGQALASLLEAARADDWELITVPAELAGGAGGGTATAGLDGILEEFLQNQVSVLEELEALVLGVERGEITTPVPRSSVLSIRSRVSRLSSGLTSERVCHRIEDMLEQVPALLVAQTLLEAIDWLGQYFRHLREGAPAPGSPDALYTRIQEQIDGEPSDLPRPSGQQTQAEAAPPASAASPAASGAASSAPISLAEIEPQLLTDFVQEAGDHLEEAEQELLRLETDPEDSEPIHALFRAIHTIKGVAGMLRLDHIQRLAHSGETLMDKARHGELLLQGERIELVFQTVDLLKRMIGELMSGGASEVSAPPELGNLLERLDSAVNDGGKASASAPAQTKSAPAPAATPNPAAASAASVPATSSTADAAEAGSSAGTASSAASAASASPAKASADGAPAPETNGTGSRPESARPTPSVTNVVKDFIKVDAARLDKMVDMIGELVIAESMVAGAKEMQDISSPELSRDLGLLNKIIRELQEIGTSLRMIPVRSTFQKMARIVRDISKKTGKHIEFVTVGEETELDKSVVDKIGDPLVHMVRNAVDHGIEATPEDRRNHGKSETGRITLRAYHREGNICIEVADDGRGIDPARIRKKAIDKGIITPEAELTESETFMLIFEPGFSTAEQVTDVSGRGVGMDVVRRNIEALRGKVQIRSVLGQGTTFVIQLPLTLAIIDGMIVRVGEDRFIVPTANVINSFQPTEQQKSSVFGSGEVVVFQGRTLPLFHLRHLFDLSQSAEEPLVLVLEADGRKIGVTVDELLGHQQIVIKSLGAALGRVPGITGGAVLPDGKIGLILDIAGLYKLTESKRSAGAPLPEPVAA